MEPNTSMPGGHPIRDVRSHKPLMYWLEVAALVLLLCALVLAIWIPQRRVQRLLREMSRLEHSEVGFIARMSGGSLKAGRHSEVFLGYDEFSLPLVILADNCGKRDWMWPFLTRMYSVKITHPGVNDAWLANLKDCQSIEALNLAGTNITDAGLAHLRRLHKLKSLNLCNTKVTDDGLRHLSALTQLDALDLTGTQVTGHGLAHLDHSSFRRLSVRGCPFDDAGMVVLSHFADLCAVDLSGTHVTNTGIAELAKIPRISEVFLAKTRITDIGVKSLGELPYLKSLCLSNTTVTDAGLAPLAATNLDNLYLADCALRGWGVRSLRVKHELDLSRTLITDASLRDVPPCWKLRLSGTQITDDGLKDFGASNSTRKTGWLDLQSTATTDRGLGLLAGAPDLYGFELANTQCTAAGISSCRELRKNLGRKDGYFDLTKVSPSRDRIHFYP